MFNFAGGLLYLVVVALSLAAAGRAPDVAWLPAWRRPRIHWLAIASVFVLLAAWRFFHGEELLQDWARQAAYAAGDYDSRRTWQGPVVTLGICGLALGIAWHAMNHRDPAIVLVSRLAATAMVAYSAIRAISFHPVDALIYRGIGPFHINHAIDLGLTGIVGACAAAALHLRARQPRSRGRIT